LGNAGREGHEVAGNLVRVLVFDLQFRPRCTHCNRRSGFRITIFDNRGRGDNSKPRLERVVVAGEDGEGNAERRCGMICEHRMYGAAISQG
jgi:hypothetical protein